MAEKVTVRAGDREQLVHLKAAEFEKLSVGRWRRKVLLEQGLKVCSDNGLELDAPTIRKYGDDK